MPSWQKILVQITKFSNLFWLFWNNRNSNLKSASILSVYHCNVFCLWFLPNKRKIKGHKKQNSLTFEVHLHKVSCTEEPCSSHHCLHLPCLQHQAKYSQAVTHPSTNLAQCCLTSVIRRELVCSTWYGRRQEF